MAFSLTLSAARHKSPTYDEEFHLTRGYAAWITGQPRLGDENLPTLGQVLALPLLILPEMTLPVDTPAWAEDKLHEVSHLFLWESGHDAKRIVFLARYPVALLAALLGAFVYRWATDLYGAKAGWVALGLYAFAPNILAHARLATTDLAIATAYFVASYCLWRFLQRSQQAARVLWGPLVLAGVTLGLALATKLTALLLLPVSLLVAGAFASSQGVRSRTRRVWRSLGVSLLAIWGIAFLTLWATYGFQVAPARGGAIPVPAASYIDSLREMRRHASEGHHAFLMGRYSLTGWWYYFPVAFGIKTPLPTLILFGLAALCAGWDLYCLVRGRSSDHGVEKLAVWIPPLALFAVSLTSTLNIGYRHILPVLPFIYVLGSGAVARIPRQRRGLGWALVAVLVAWTIVGSLSVYPHYLTYFNELIGGPDQGYRYLVDSNLDWGQDLPGLKRYIDQHGIHEVKLAWFGSADPAYYQIPYDPLPSRALPFRDETGGRYETFYPAHPAPGVYAISATHLQAPYFDDHDLYNWFREREPVDWIGGSIAIYRVEPDGSGPVTLALADTSLAEIRPGAYERLGTNDVAVRRVAPGSVIVAPNSRAVWRIGGDSEAIAQAAGRLLRVDRGSASRFSLADGRTVAALRLHPKDGLEREIQWLSEQSAAHYPSSEPADLPVDFGHVVEFLGYERSPRAALPGEEVRWMTYWRVLGESTVPLKVFVHVVDDQGEIVAQQDVSTSPAGTWEPGDVLVHAIDVRIPLDAAPGEYLATIGWYEQESWRRLPVYREGSPVSDNLGLGSLKVAQPLPAGQ
jgi:hypothetical protein